MSSLANSEKIHKLINEKMTLFLSNQDYEEVKTPKDLNDKMSSYISWTLSDQIILNTIKEVEHDFIKTELEKIKLNSSTDNEAIIDCVANSILCLYLDKLLSNNEETKIFKISNEINQFEKNSKHKIEELKLFLINKHPLLEKLLVSHFDEFQKKLNQELSEAKSWLSTVDQINLDGKNANDLFFSKTKGRPSSILIDLILINLKTTAEELKFENPYADFIIPLLLILCDRFSDQLDRTDFHDYEKLRKRYAYLEIKYREHDNSST